MAYLADIFDMRNTLNMSLQGQGTTAFSENDKILHLKLKLTLFSFQAMNNDFSSHAVQSDIFLTNSGEHYSLFLL